MDSPSVDSPSVDSVENFERTGLHAELKSRGPNRPPFARLSSLESHCTNYAMLGVSGSRLWSATASSQPPESVLLETSFGGPWADAPGVGSVVPRRCCSEMSRAARGACRITFRCESHGRYETLRSLFYKHLPATTTEGVNNYCTSDMPPRLSLLNAPEIRVDELARLGSVLCQDDIEDDSVALLRGVVPDL